MAELSSLVMDTDDQHSDSELDEETTLQRLKFCEEEEDNSALTNAAPTKRSWFSFRKKPRDTEYGPLSVQSGDIVRSNESINTAPEPSHHVSRLNENNLSLSLAFKESKERFREGFYAILFPFVYLFVKQVFGRSKHKPLRTIVPFFLLAGNFAVVLALLMLIIFKFTPSFNLNISAFGIPSHPAQVHWDAYRAAARNSVKNETSQPTLDDLVKRGIVRRDVIPDCDEDPYAHYQTVLTNTEMDLVYRVKDGENILSSENLNYLHEIEKHIYTSHDYQKVCHKRTSTAPCDVLVSLLSWLYPQDKTDGSYIYPPPNLTTTIQILKQDASIAPWFTGGTVERIGDSYYKSSFLRAQIRVGLPIPCYRGNHDRRDEQNVLLTRFFVSLIPYLESKSNGDIEILYGGTLLFDYEVHSAIIHDLTLAIGSFVAIIVVTMILTGFSIWLTFFGLLTIASCFPLALFVFRVVLGIESLSILTIISAFVIIGIGVDDIFVFINTFKQSASLAGMDTPEKRLAHTILEASKATFFTSVTTSVAFFANAVSSIPAVKQFGIFMGLVVFCCYIQVTFVLPLCLYIWHYLILPIENWVFSKIYKHLCRCCKRTRGNVTIPVHAVRMSTLPEEDDSGIDILGNGNGSSNDTSDNSSTSSTASGSDSNLIGSNSNSNTRIPSPIPNSTTVTRITVIQQRDTSPLLNDEDGDSERLLENQAMTSGEGDSTTAPATSESIGLIETSPFTHLLQTIMLKAVGRVVMLPFLWRASRYGSSQRKEGVCSRFSPIQLTMVGVFVALLAGTFTMSAFLDFTDHPPQFFNPNSNIQKMLDLSGNLTDSSAIDCYKCSPWYDSNYNPTQPTSPPVIPPSSSTGNHDNQHTTSSSHSNSPPVTLPPTTKPTPPDTRPSDHSSPTTPTPRTPPITKPTSNSSSNSLPPTISTSHHTSPPSHSQSPHTDPVTPPPSGSHGTTPSVFIPTPPPNATHSQSVTNRYLNNAIVYVVFGIETIERKYDPAHVLPEDGDGDWAVLDKSFHTNFTCPLPRSGLDLTGSLRALCRICHNISNPDNGLTLNGTFMCFPAAILSQFRCLSDQISHISECVQVLNDYHDPSTTLIKADYKYDTNKDGSASLRYLAMAFRSTSNPNDSPFSAIQDYNKWEEFLSNELKEIFEQKDLYRGAEQMISSTYQTSEYWVQLNIEMVAIYSSLYGIALSLFFCMVVAAFLTHDWRIFVSMFLTITGILFFLLALFKVFSWKIGIVEAVSLSILVGNSLDYCIHLSEGYVSTDARHLAFVNKFRFAVGAPLRAKRVMAAISFIGVSIISSAITTILATIPLLSTHIQLFTRFGAIVLLDTVVAIVYTLVFCGTFLALIGPLRSKFSIWSVINGIATIFSMFAFWGFVVLVVYLLSVGGVPILSPNGTPLFK